MISINFVINFTPTHLVRRRYGAECTVLAVPGGVATRWNGTTIPPRRALPCTPITAHSTPSNYRF